jgi:acyl CoA:acetate/3-ketoacid CoA transferase beta subunit
MEFRPADLMCVCIARHVRDGEILAQGLATPLVAAGYLLAWQMHAPHVYFASAIGQSVCREGVPIGLSRVEDLWLARALRLYGFVPAVAEMLPCVRPKEYFRPGQVDAVGRFNNVALGRDPRRPRFRLPGSGGIPDVTTVFTDIHLYVPRHSRAVFVEKLDFASSLGHTLDRRHGRGPQYLVSELGQFDFAHGRLRLTHVHPGVTLEDIDRRTGFAVERSSEVAETPPPTERELDLLRTVVDPLNVRQLEFLSGGPRRQALEAILQAEQVEQRRL